jgi:murein DD-endopeptidase MepM/ murein hydrolase activator NlpD
MAATTALGIGARAGAAPGLPLPTSTTTTAPPGSTTTTTSPLPGSTTTTAPGPGGSSTTTTTATTQPGQGGGGDAPPSGGQTIPPEYLPLIQGVKRSPPNSTKALLAALRPLRDLGVSPAQIVASGFGHFPVGGEANFIDDWWYPRFTPTFHLHQGTDIFAAEGTPVRSPADGVLRQSNEGVGGMSAYVTTKDGTYFYMAHLSAFVDGQTTGQKVHAGDVVGLVGATGDAQGGPAHCHFEVHPLGGPATDPKAILDGWLADALANAPAVVAAYEAKIPRALLTTALTRGIQGFGSSSVFAAPTGPSRAQLLWVGSANPSGGALRLAQAAALDAARGIDWEAEAQRQLARRQGQSGPARG